MSLASYLQAVALGGQVHSVLDHAAVSKLVKVARDQGRLGDLLKLWLVDSLARGMSELEVRRWLDRLGDPLGTLVAVALLTEVTERCEGHAPKAELSRIPA